MKSICEVRDLKKKKKNPNKQTNYLSEKEEERMTRKQEKTIWAY